jgi:predicted permease
VNVAPLAEADPSSQFYADGGETLVGSAGYRVVSPDYLRAMAIPLRSGRSFGEDDRPGAPHAVLVNEVAARRFWPGESAIGHRVRFPGMDKHGAEWLTVVGVVGDVRHRGLDERAHAEMYVSYRQRPERLGEQATIVLRGSAPPEMLATALRGVIRAADPEVAVSLSSMRAALDRSVAPRRFTTSVLAGFGALALFLAAVGIYGVLAYSVARRRRELSVRLALGGQPSDLRRMIVRDALRAVVPGIVVGVVVSLALSGSLRAMLYGVSALDPASFATVVVLLLSVALVAAYLPARRATRVDPLLAMRGD